MVSYQYFFHLDILVFPDQKLLAQLMAAIIALFFRNAAAFRFDPRYPGTAVIFQQLIDDRFFGLCVESLFRQRSPPGRKCDFDFYFRIHYRSGHCL